MKDKEKNRYKMGILAEEQGLTLENASDAIWTARLSIERELDLAERHYRDLAEKLRLAVGKRNVREISEFDICTCTVEKISQTWNEYKDTIAYMDELNRIAHTLRGVDENVDHIVNRKRQQAEKDFPF